MYDSQLPDSPIFAERLDTKENRTPQEIERQRFIERLNRNRVILTPDNFPIYLENFQGISKFNNGLLGVYWEDRRKHESLGPRKKEISDLLSAQIMQLEGRRKLFLSEVQVTLDTITATYTKAKRIRRITQSDFESFEIYKGAIDDRNKELFPRYFK